MGARSRRPTDEATTEVDDPARPRPGMVAPTEAASGVAVSAASAARRPAPSTLPAAARRPAPSTLPAPAGAPPPSSRDTPSSRDASSSRDAPSSRAASPSPSAPRPYESFEGAATEVGLFPGRAVVERATPTEIDPVPSAPSAPAAPIARAAERSEPLRVISMKDQAVADKPRPAEPRVPLHIQLRSIAEVAGRDTPRELGRLAPPRDPEQVRARHRRANLRWAFVAIGLAAALALAIWLVAGR